VADTYATSRNGTRLLILEPGRADRHFWRDLWEFRELFFILAWRTVTVRYKQTVIGIAWAGIRPFITVLILTIVFGRIARLPSEGDAPYAIMVLAGMLPWFLVSSILSDASNSLVQNANLVRRVYFPRVIVPASAVIVSLIDLMINFLILGMFMLWFDFWPGARIVWLPMFLAMAVLASLGPAFLIAALNVKYRDFRLITPFIIQFGLYVSPVGFSSSVIPPEYRFWYSLNPLVGVIDGFRWCLLGTESQLYLPGFFLSLCIVVFLLWVGVSYFRRAERTFADVI
jgi:lipopolysaccharide transport system permease protein